MGRTTSAVTTKERSGGTRWDKKKLLEAADEYCTPEEKQVVTKLFQHCEDEAGRFSWGTGATAGVTGWYSMQPVQVVAEHPVPAALRQVLQHPLVCRPALTPDPPLHLDR